VRGENCVLGLCRKLIFQQLCHMLVAEHLVVLRVVDDGPALPAVVITTWRTSAPGAPFFPDVFNPVIRKFFFQGLEQVDLSSFAALLIRHLFKGALQLVDLIG